MLFLIRFMFLFVRVSGFILSSEFFFATIKKEFPLQEGLFPITICSSNFLMILPLNDSSTFVAKLFKAFGCGNY